MFAGVWTCQANSRIHSWHLSSIYHREGLDKMTVCTSIESGVRFVMIALAPVRMTGHNKRHVLQTISPQLSAFVIDVFYIALTKGPITCAKQFISLFKWV